jgi:2,3-bisphosphoglycerate-independent phosphoglycerate mutase
MKSDDAILLDASGECVGLPAGQCGNSEVGHLTIGAGRILKQKLPLITDSIGSGELNKNEKLNDFLNSLNGNACHIMTLFSNGGVHSDIGHFFWAIDYLRQKNVTIMAHLFLDGRDVAYRDALGLLEAALESGCLRLSEIATIQGRFFAMDRDNRWDRTRPAFDAIVHAKADSKTNDPTVLIRNFYDLDINDEVIPPFIVSNYKGASIDDGFWMLNFRTDRIKQILTLLQDDGFKVLNMVSCDEKIDSKATVLFEQKEVKSTLGEVVSRNGLRQLRIAETEKYAHVTYFLNGGMDVRYEGEERILIQSPRVSDYSETPDMSSEQVSLDVIDAMKSTKYDLIIANFANADMIGHTGNFKAAKMALAFLDTHIRDIVAEAQCLGYTVILTADHGNAENMINDDNSIHKSHTCSKVPFILLSQSRDLSYRQSEGQLSDIAPTILNILGINIPREMTGSSLV